MKNILTKTIVTPMTISIVFGNVSICGVGITNAIAENATLPEIELNAENTKFVKTQTQNYTGLAVQTKVSVNSKQSEETYLPTTSVELKIKLPEVNSHFPERANVVLAKTMQTTGEKENVKINQNYDKTSGLLTVSYANENEYTKFVQDSKDELEIIYIYSAEVVTENMEEVNLTYNISASVQYKTESGVLTSETAKTIQTTEKENKGNILSYNTTDIQNKIYKGFMYSNVENGTKYNTDFKTISTLNVLNSNAVDEITMETNDAEFLLKSNQKISSNGNVVYSATGINKNEFDRILGGNGKIEIYQNEEVIATVTYADGSYSQIEDGKESIVIEYKQNLNAIKIKTTQPIAEGNMHFENQATILNNTNYGTNVENMEKLEITNSVNQIFANQTIMLNEARTKISVETNEPNFTTLQKTNSNVIVKLDDTNPSAKLFNAPTIKITLPEGIAYGNVSHSEILNGNGLEIKSVKTQGNNVIYIELEGKQTEYDLENISGGTSIVLNLEELQYKNTLASRKDKIVATCVQGAEQIEASCDVNIVSKEGVLIFSTLNNFDGNNTQETTMENKTVEIKNNADAYEATRNIVFVNNNDEDLTNVTIIEKIGTNSENENSTFVANLTKPVEVENAKVYYSENENSDVNDNTWTTDFTKNAKAYKVELNNNTLLAKQTIIIKEYIQIPGQIDCNEKSFLKLGMSYNTNNNYEQKEMVLGLKTQESEIGKNKIKSFATLTNENQETIPLELTITPQITQNYVHANQFVNYIIKVENKSENTLKNVIVKDIIPSNAIYVYKKELEGDKEDEKTKEINYTIEQLNPHEIKEIKISLKMANVNTQQEILNMVNLTYNNKTINAESKLTLKPGQIETTLKTVWEELYNSEDGNYNIGDYISYYVNIKNTTQNKLKNVKVCFQIPTDLDYINGGLAVWNGVYEVNDNGNLNNNTFEYIIKELEPNEEKNVIITVTPKNNNTNNIAKINSIANVIVNNENYETNNKIVNINKAFFVVNLTSNVQNEETKKVGDTVTYNYTVKNIGNARGKIKIANIVPNEIEVNKIEYGTSNMSSDSNLKNEINKSIYLESNEQYTLKITGTIKTKDVKSEEIVKIINKVELYVGLLKIESNEVSFNVKYEPTKAETPGEPTMPSEPTTPSKPDEPKDIEVPTIPDSTDQPTQPDNPEQPTEPTNPEQPTTPENPEQPTQPDTPEQPTEPTNPEQPTTPENPEQPTQPDKPSVSEKYSISGIAWVDSNKNGKKDDGEALQHSVVVTLIDKTTGNFALDSNGNKITTTTNNNGVYEFTNIPKGNYIVLFEFDTNTFTVTTYKKEGIDESINSDVILTQVRINGNLKTAAVTDEIALTENKTNINIGLMENAKFDLSLNKYISKISIINKEGTQTEEYKPTDEVAKIDIKAKYMNGTHVIVTYKFAVTNNGDVAGFVDSLQDDLPSGLEFSSDLNKDWYKGTDGKLYTSALSKVAINPNETKEIELVLTKTMTEDNAGIFTNNASLTKISNLANVQENTKAIENNNSSAILAISIKTGSAWLYLGITLSCITIFAIGAYIIKKKVLNENI